MSTDEYSTEIELYGVSPGIIGVIMFFVSISFPFGFIFGAFGIPLALIFIFVNPYALLPLTIPNILYAIRIVKYYQGKSTKSSAIIVGLLSVILPPIIILPLSWISIGILHVFLPIPIQFIAGLILMWRIEGPEVISPWSGMRLDLSWWKWERPKRKSDWDPFKEEKKALEKEDSVNSE